MKTDAQTALKNLAKAQYECLLAALDCQEHIFALEAVLIALDHRAQEMLKQQIAVEHGKNQKQREMFEIMLRSLQTIPPTSPS